MSACDPLLVTTLVLAAGCARSAPVSPERAAGVELTWTDTIAHHVVGDVQYTRCGTLVHIWASHDLHRRPWEGLQLTVSPFRDRADTLLIQAPYGTIRGQQGWAYATLYGSDGIPVGNVAGRLVLDRPGEGYISGQVSGLLVRIDPVAMRTDTLGPITARFGGRRSREQEKIVYQMVTCPADDRAPPPTHWGM